MDDRTVPNLIFTLVIVRTFSAASNKRIATDTENLSGADLPNLCTEAGMFAIRRIHNIPIHENENRIFI